MLPWSVGTGPATLGPMTGKGLDRCAGYLTAGYTRGAEVEYLKEDTGSLRAELERIESRLKSCLLIRTPFLLFLSRDQI